MLLGLLITAQDIYLPAKKRWVWGPLQQYMKELSDPDWNVHALNNAL